MFSQVEFSSQMTCAKILRSDLGHEFEPDRLAQTNFLVFGNCFRFDSIFFGTPPGWYLTFLFGRMRQGRFSLEVPVAQAFRTIRKTNLSNTNIDLLEKPAVAAGFSMSSRLEIRIRHFGSISEPCLVLVRLNPIATTHRNLGVACFYLMRNFILSSFNC